jgi:hypothetical protein
VGFAISQPKKQGESAAATHGGTWDLTMKENAKEVTLTELVRLFSDDLDAKALIDSSRTVQDVWDKCQDGGLMIAILQQWNLLDADEAATIVSSWREQEKQLPKTIGWYCREVWNLHVIDDPPQEMHVTDIVYRFYVHHIHKVAEADVCVNYLAYVLKNEKPVDPNAEQFKVKTLGVSADMKLDECHVAAMKAEAANQADLIRSVVKVQFEGADSSASPGANDTVRVYDWKTGSISVIPAAELAPGYIRVTREGVGQVFTRIDQLDASAPIRHPPFSREVRRIFWRLKKALDDVCTQTMDAWETGFRKDQDPGPQILSWVRTAQLYEKCLRILRPIGLDSRKGIFQVIQSCTVNGPEHALQVLNVPAESRAIVLKIVEIFKEPPEDREIDELRRVAQILDSYFGPQHGQPGA